MFFKWLMSRHKNKQIKAWIKHQSHAEDAIAYLIEKELFEHGITDLSYRVPRKRSQAYFEQLLGPSEAPAYTRQPQTAFRDIELREEASFQAKQMAQPIQKAVGASNKVTNINALKSVNRSNSIYHQVSSAVVYTAPEEQFHHENADMSCFED